MHVSSRLDLQGIPRERGRSTCNVIDRLHERGSRIDTFWQAARQATALGVAANVGEYLVGEVGGAPARSAHPDPSRSTGLSTELATLGSRRPEANNNAV